MVVAGVAVVVVFELVVRMSEGGNQLHNKT
jgi:hypothetical protein